VTSLPDNTKLQLPVPATHPRRVPLQPRLFSPKFQVATRATAATRKAAVLLLRVFIFRVPAPFSWLPVAFPRLCLSRPSRIRGNPKRTGRTARTPPCMLIRRRPAVDHRFDNRTPNPTNDRLGFCFPSSRTPDRRWNPTRIRQTRWTRWRKHDPRRRRCFRASPRQQQLTQAPGRN
jgi:hypothetical protein